MAIVKKGPSRYVWNWEAPSGPREFPRVYMAHPVTGDVEGNVEKATQLLIELKRSFPDRSIVAPWIFDVQAFDDSDPVLREEGLRRCFEAIATCDELWLCGDRVSGGMAREAAVADALGIKIRNMTKRGGGE